jgi:hypothetical protein
MHNFSELIDRCTEFTLGALKEVEEKTYDALQTNGATSLVKTLQMIRLEKTILAVGIFSIFESMLQDRLKCVNGFVEAKDILKQKGDQELVSQFSDLELAINTLKHGRGRSYNSLVSKEGGSLPSKIKLPDENFLDEGDASEITTLIDVDDKFIYSCIDIINQVSQSIMKIRPEVIL